MSETVAVTNNNRLTTTISRTKDKTINKKIPKYYQLSSSAVVMPSQVYDVIAVVVVVNSSIVFYKWQRFHNLNISTRGINKPSTFWSNRNSLYGNTSVTSFLRFLSDLHICHFPF
eukprot:GHVS01014474.1.p2 GENE.GHVS01014474.1~~GHVS01014474.1.p2  ORF type:complete len:115 (+),score=21.52 GHVS01014474.1:170-514(+)